MYVGDNFELQTIIVNIYCKHRANHCSFTIEIYSYHIIYYPCHYVCIVIIIAALINGWCPGDENGVYADPHSCSTFLNCAGVGTRFVRAYRQPCPKGLFFNPEEKYCDWPQNVPDCPKSPMRTTTTTPTPDKDEVTSYLTTEVPIDDTTAWEDGSGDEDVFFFR